MRENSIQEVWPHFCDKLNLHKFLTSRGYSVHYRSKLPLPLLRQASLAQSLKMCLHGGVHGQEIALKEAAECGGGHFSYLQAQEEEMGSCKCSVSLYHNISYNTYYNGPTDYTDQICCQ